MDIDSITIGQARQIAAMVSPPEAIAGEFVSATTGLDNGMVGKYVIVRCRDAGVHAGVLEAHSGREAVLRESRRLWYWKPAGGAKFLSGIARRGLDAASKVGAPIRVHLTETCEIIECAPEAESSIRGMATDGAD